MIFGSFAEQPVEQVIGAIARRSGRLQVWQTASHCTDHFELQLEQGCLRSLVVNGLPVHEEHHARSVILELFASRTGIFQFCLAPAKASESAYRLPIGTLVPGVNVEPRPRSAPSIGQRLRQALRRLPPLRQAA
ncbi:hypothetical protein [Deinococcus peraridilitoris]|uniref:DUF4388 domain-containing protein n=1 Tax=Deinococcus peraridilitoris (strain DSM 19664 / LMG 22246 / CIP 109416 / KR-200) TaxID=937777 RepID=L0A554_DEIPD|nr:hypothetical protein [Deinococcus peraridilitoris]AFZ68115.1 hypothetical protein Deipe_2650 [Deinococcus peraridilitoris DSM 19664]